MTPQDLIVQLRTTLTGDATGRIVIAVALAVFLVIVVGAVVFIVRQLSPRGRLQALLESQSTTRSTPAWGVRIATLCLVGVALLGTRFYLVSSNTCANCHGPKSAESKTLATTAHKNQQCGACHADSGMTGNVRLGLDYARWTYVWATTGKIPKTLTADVDELRCLRCHEEIRSGTKTVEGIKVRHSDFLAEAVQCSPCHSDIAHPGVKTASAVTPGMNGCLPCHDGKRASAECKTCHTQELGEHQSHGQIAGVDASSRGDACYTCHDPKPCTSCHGVQMPHPDDWITNKGGSHVREGFVHLDRCWRCHYKDEPGTPDPKACGCHQLVAKGGMHGGPVWIGEHGLEATGKKQGALADCRTCHSEHFCSDCHPASYNDLYNPKVGYDEYQRDKPLDPKWLDY